MTFFACSLSSHYYGYNIVLLQDIIHFAIKKSEIVWVWVSPFRRPAWFIVLTIHRNKDPFDSEEEEAKPASSGSTCIAHFVDTLLKYRVSTGNIFILYHIYVTFYIFNCTFLLMLCVIYNYRFNESTPSNKRYAWHFNISILKNNYD